VQNKHIHIIFHSMIVQEVKIALKYMIKKLIEMPHNIVDAILASTEKLFNNAALNVVQLNKIGTLIN